MMFALIDCNNFYVSCEALFKPELKNRPVVVLSNNDGCVIARSQEAKDLGIPMGAPAFKYQTLFHAKKVIVLSSNYTLYGDLSRRVMETLKNFGYPIEIYSIDEAFLKLPHDVSEELGYEIRRTIQQHIGITVSVGIAKTKTLAKVANKCAKKKRSGIFLLNHNIDDVLKTFPVEDIWGVGRAYAEKLRSHQIKTAFDFKEKEDSWVKKMMTVVGLRTQWELRGLPCLSCEEVKALRKTIICSRSFSKEIISRSHLQQKVAHFIATAAKDLREEKLLAEGVTLFLLNNRHKAQHTLHLSKSLLLPTPTNYTPSLIAASKRLLNELYRENVAYKKAGIMLFDLVPEKSAQLDLFHSENSAKQTALMRSMDAINKRYAKKALFFAQQGLDQKIRSPGKAPSPHYTTQWEELLTVDLEKMSPRHPQRTPKNSKE